MVVQDLLGNVVDSASVSVYLAGTTTPATVYPTRTSTLGSNVAPQASSAQDGSVVFWLDSNDYSYGQLFDIVVQKGTFSFQLSDVQIIVWDAVNAVKLDGQDGAYYLNRANHTGTQPPNTISPQGSGSGLDADKVDGYDAGNSSGQVALSNGVVCVSLNADMVDGFHASLIPGPNIIVPLNPDGVLNLSATYVKSNVYSLRRVDLTNATSDYMLQVGEEAYKSFSNATSVPLRIATASNALYWLYCTRGCHLFPNNTTYSNAFKVVDWGVNFDGSSAAEYVYGLTDSSFHLGNPSGAGSIIAYIDISNAKTITQHIASFSSFPYSIRHTPCHWISPTSWTSLGTLTFLSATSGYVLIRRLA
jgi:hypothetical protein